MPTAQSALTSVTIFFACLIAGCQESSRTPANPNIDTISGKVIVKPISARDQLIRALKELRQLADTTDSLKVARMFRFPVADSLITLSGDSLFESEKQRNNGLVSERLFYSGFHQFIAELQLDELQAAYEHLDINRLSGTDSLGYLEKDNKNVCLHAYRILIEHDSVVRVEAALNLNAAYKGKKTDENVEGPEYLLWWIFGFDGRKLYLINHAEAD